MTTLLIDFEYTETQTLDKELFFNNSDWFKKPNNKKYPTLMWVKNLNNKSKKFSYAFLIDWLKFDLIDRKQSFLELLRKESNNPKLELNEIIFVFKDSRNDKEVLYEHFGINLINIENDSAIIQENYEVNETEFDKDFKKNSRLAFNLNENTNDNFKEMFEFAFNRNSSYWETSDSKDWKYLFKSIEGQKRINAGRIINVIGALLFMLEEPNFISSDLSSLWNISLENIMQRIELSFNKYSEYEKSQFIKLLEDLMLQYINQEVLFTLWTLSNSNNLNHDKVESFILQMNS